MKRTKACTEVGLEDDMVAISPRSVLKDVSAGTSPVVNSELVKLTGAIEDQPLVLSWGDLSVEQMLKMLAYPASKSILRYSLHFDVDVTLSHAAWEVLPDVLQSLVESFSSHGVPALEDKDMDPRAEVLQELVQHGLVHAPSDDNFKYNLTPLGKRSITIGQELHAPEETAGQTHFIWPLSTHFCPPISGSLPHSMCLLFCLCATLPQ